MLSMAEITVTGGKLEQPEIKAYVEHVEKENPGRSLKSLRIAVDGDFVDLTYELEPVPFERIRRITGYLVGTMDRWNNAKRAEERDRVKHGVSSALNDVVSEEARKSALQARAAVESCSDCG